MLVVGGRLQVEIDEISEDGELIDLRCLEIYKQVAPPKQKQQQQAPKKAAARRDEEEDEEDEEDGGFYSDDEEEDDDDFNRLGYDDEW